MKKLYTFIALTALTACQSSGNFSQIKKGMHTKDVVSLVGEPDVKTPLLGVEWWMYSKKNKMIVISSDTVVNVKMDLKASQDSLKKLGDAFNSSMDSLKGKVDSL